MKISTYTRLSDKGRHRANITYHIETAIICLLASGVLIAAGWLVVIFANRGI